MQKNTRIWGASTISLLTLTHLAGIYAVNSDFQNFDCRLTQLENQMNPPSDTPCYGWYFVAVEALAWKAYENGLPIAIETKDPFYAVNPFLSPNYASLLRHGKTKNLNFNWDPGFRVAVGRQWSNDWALSLTWLRFFTKAERHLHASSGKQLQPVQLAAVDGFGILPSEISSTAIPSSGPMFSKAAAHWYAHLNQLDLTLCRPFHVGKWLSLAPYFGLRTTWLQQRLSVNYKNNLVIPFDTPGDDYDVRKKCSWWGIGPEAGFGIGFDFRGGWSIIGRAAAAIEYGLHKIKEIDIDTTVAKTGADGILVDSNDSYRMAHPIFDLQLALGWDHTFKEGRYKFRLEGGWEQHVYFSQNQLPSYYNQTVVGDFISNQGDLAYQGWRFAVQLDF
jgi:hypothetical protein